MRSAISWHSTRRFGIRRPDRRQTWPCYGRANDTWLQMMYSTSRHGWPRMKSYECALIGSTNGWPSSSGWNAFSGPWKRYVLMPLLSSPDCSWTPSTASKPWTSSKFRSTKSLLSPGVPQPLSYPKTTPTRCCTLITLPTKWPRSSWLPTSTTNKATGSRPGMLHSQCCILSWLRYWPKRSKDRCGKKWVL